MARVSCVWGLRCVGFVVLAACSAASSADGLQDGARAGAGNAPGAGRSAPSGPGTSPGEQGTSPDGGVSPDGATGGEAGPPPDGGAFSGAFAQERKACFELSNKLRAKAGVAPLTRALDKEACVDEQSHQESLIDTPHGKLGMCNEARQNHGDGTGWQNLELIDTILNEQFNEGPGGPHYGQMTDPRMTRVACGFYLSPAGNFWIDVDFF